MPKRSKKSEKPEWWNYYCKGHDEGSLLTIQKIREHILKLADEKRPDKDDALVRIGYQKALLDMQRFLDKLEGEK